MNRIILIALGVLLSVQVFAQKVDDEKKTKKNKPLARLDQADRIMVDLFTDIWMNTPDKSVMSIKTINRGANAYGMRDIPIGRSNFSFAIGAGISFHNLYSDAIPVSEKTLDPADSTFKYSGMTAFKKIPKGETISNTVIGYKNNKITLVYIDIPIEFRFRTKNEGQKFKFALGFKGGYLISSHTKYHGNDIRYNYNDVTHTQGWDLLSDQNVMVKYYKVPNLESYRFGPTFRIGWGWISLSAYYSLTTLFKKDKGPDMYPISVGLTITPI